MNIYVYIKVCMISAKEVKLMRNTLNQPLMLTHHTEQRCSITVWKVSGAALPSRILSWIPMARLEQRDKWCPFLKGIVTNFDDAPKPQTAKREGIVWYRNSQRWDNVLVSVGSVCREYRCNVKDPYYAIQSMTLLAWKRMKYEHYAIYLWRSTHGTIAWALLSLKLTKFVKIFYKICLSES
jgi:hypothetical protein